MKKQFFILTIIVLMSTFQVFAQLHNTIFTSLSSGFRDSSSDKGAIYYLNGNTTNGRLNLGSSAIWQVADNTHILVNGNPNHSYMNGIIRSTGLVYVGRPSGGRFDFSGPDGGMEAHDITYYYTGNGFIYNHLENARNKFTGFVRFIFDMSAGTAYVQFESREYANVTLNVKPTNGSLISVYPARSSAGFTSLPGFSTLNLQGTLELSAGGYSDSHGRIYDPSYIGAINNLLPINVRGGGSGHYTKEYFTIDITGIAHSDTKIRVSDNTNTVQHDGITLTTANTTIYANNGTTPLSDYEGKRVVPVLVRTITQSLSNTRNTISYLIRRAGFHEIRVDNFAMNAPVVIEDLLVDENWSNTGVISTITNLDEFYDEAKKAEANDLSLPVLITANGTTLDFGNRNILLDTSAGSAFVINTGTNTITIKSAAVLTEGTKFNTLKTSGAVSTANGASLEFGYENPIGTINKYVVLSNLSSTDTVLIRDNLTNTILVNITGITGDFKAHFIAPADASDLEVSVTRPNFSTFLENYPENDMSFVREINLQLTQVVAESQIEILNLVMKILQKEEAMYRALDLTNPTLTVTNTISGASGAPTVANQLAILEILNKVFIKVIANRRKLE